MRRTQVYPQTLAIGLPLIVTPCTRDTKVVFTTENLKACPMYTFTLVHLVFRVFIRFDLLSSAIDALTEKTWNVISDFNKAMEPDSKN